MTLTLSDLIDRKLLPYGAANIPVPGVAHDSREVRPGFLFAALPGTRVHGNDFIPQALEAGAGIILCDKTLGPGAAGRVPVIRVDNPHKSYAKIVANYYRVQPETIVAVTGTNGKTSVASFVRQIWSAQGNRAASLGTVGIEAPEIKVKLAHTTPDPITLHSSLAELVRHDVTHAALEASSHGLAQFRMDGVKIKAAGFTNITRDHLDYHPDFEDYLNAKLRLFSEVMERDGSAVLNADIPEFKTIAKRIADAGIKVMSVGNKGEGLKIFGSRREGFSQNLTIETPDRKFEVLLPLVGDFQTSNALVAAGLVIAAGGDAGETIPHLSKLQGAIGRLELVATAKQGGPIFVDYAHTPDALATALQALRPYVEGALHVVFGCGGDRDPGQATANG